MLSKSVVVVFSNSSKQNKGQQKGKMNTSKKKKRENVVRESGKCKTTQTEQTERKSGLKMRTRIIRI